MDRDATGQGRNGDSEANGLASPLPGGACVAVEGHGMSGKRKYLPKRKV
jgi:hypothetical protein